MTAYRPSLRFIGRSLQRFDARTRDVGRLRSAGKWLRRAAGVAAAMIPAAAGLVSTLAPPLQEALDDIVQTAASSSDVSFTLNQTGSASGGPSQECEGEDCALTLSTVRNEIRRMLDARSSAGTATVVLRPNIDVSGVGGERVVQKTVALAPLGRSWYRTALQPEDLFWALPDADFRLSVADTRGCDNAASCSGTIQLEPPEDSVGGVATPLLAVTDGAFDNRFSSRCVDANEGTNIRLCELKQGEANQPLCVWFRLPGTDGASSRQLEFDVQWRSPRDAGSDARARCGRLSQ